MGSFVFTLNLQAGENGAFEELTPGVRAGAEREGPFRFRRPRSDGSLLPPDTSVQRKAGFIYAAGARP